MAPLWAEEADKTSGQQSDEPMMHLEPVVVSGRAAVLLGIAGSASQGQVGQTEIERRPLLRPAEVLEVIPGLATTQHSGTGKANQYFLRGFNLDHGTDFFTRVDGMPVNLPTHGHGQGYMDLNFLRLPRI
jgi:outer membrane receptor for Fe3+-dicitrate